MHYISKVLSYIRFKDNKTVDISAKKATDMPDHIKPRIKWKSTHTSCKQYVMKLNKLLVGYAKLNHRHLMLRNDQHVDWKLNIAFISALDRSIAKKYIIIQKSI